MFEMGLKYTENEAVFNKTELSNCCGNLTHLTIMDSSHRY